VYKRQVYIVGAGPGDPDLITVKAAKAIKKADVIVYDFLANSKLLKLAKKDSEKICVGKTDGLHLFEQGAINKLLYNKANKGNIIVRLKGGDPLVFSRGVEETLYLKTKRIDFEIIQGITSAFGAPESFGIPLTRKGFYSSVAVLTGRKSNGEPLDAPACDTLIYLMAVASIDKVIRALLASGKSKNTPCAFIERGTTEKERIITGNLGNIKKRAEDRRVISPSVFIVGNILNYGKKIYGHKY